jgi:hypothetical protein
VKRYDVFADGGADGEDILRGIVAGTPLHCSVPGTPLPLVWGHLGFAAIGVGTPLLSTPMAKGPLVLVAIRVAVGAGCHWCWDTFAPTALLHAAHLLMKHMYEVMNR